MPLSSEQNSTLVNGYSEEDKKLVNSGKTDDHDLVLKTFRLLIADLCEQFGGGHPG